MLATGVMLLAAAPDRDGPFDGTPHPTAPDYAHRQDWAVWRGGSPSSSVDIFFIQPTTFISQRWNQDLSDDQTDRLTRLSVTNRQINAFDDCCRIYSPRYRQASSRAFGEMAGDGSKAYALAYQDVRAAFRWYLNHENRGRPFVVAAHSQGSLHALRLIEEEVDGTPIARRLIAVYAPGIGIPLGLFGTALKTIGPCDTPTSTRCIASWNSYTPDADATRFVERSIGHAPNGGAGLLCTNPLTFDNRFPAAGSGANDGAMLAPPGEDVMPPLVPHAAGAACRNGVLRIDTTVPLKPLPGGVLHFYDIPLFWANIRANVETRIRSYRQDQNR